MFKMLIERIYISYKKTGRKKRKRAVGLLNNVQLFLIREPAGGDAGEPAAARATEIKKKKSQCVIKD